MLRLDTDVLESEKERQLNMIELSKAKKGL